MDELILTNDTDFDRQLNDPKAIIVDFWSPTCAPCIQLEPRLKKIATEYRSRVKILKVNVNDCPRTSSKYLIRGLPTLLFIKNRNVKTQMVGTISSQMIEQKLQEVI